MTEPTTAPSVAERAAVRGIERTKVVRPRNEQQLELPWTVSVPAQPEVDTSALRETSEEGRQPGTPAAPVIEPIARRAYPHAYDPEGPAGAAVAILREARDEATRAVELFTGGDQEGAASRISLLAGMMAQAYPHTAFNPALGAAVSFIRRATLLADPWRFTTDSLMSLARANRLLSENPLISLDASTDCVIDLERHGWLGEDGNVAAFVRSLITEQEAQEQKLIAEKQQ